MTNATLSPAPRRASPTTPDARPSASKSNSPIKLLLVDFRSGESVCQHPDVAPLLHDGWSIRSAVPRLVEDEGPKLLVVLTHQRIGIGRPLGLAARAGDAPVTVEGRMS